MQLSAGSTRKSRTNEPDEDEEVGTLGGLDVSVDTMDCVYLDVHEVIVMTAEEYSDLKNVTTKVESVQRHEERRDPGSFESRERSTKELGLMCEHNMHELVKNADARGGSHANAKMLQDHLGEKLHVTQHTPPMMVARLLLARLGYRILGTFRCAQ